MLKLDLKETEVTAGLLLAAVVADQTAANLDVGFCVCGLTDKLVGELPEATFVLRQVFITHLSRRLGQGFTVSDDDQGLVTVALDMADDTPEAVETTAADTVEEAQGGTNEPEATNEEEPTADDQSPEIGAAPRRRGRPPGSRTRPSSSES
jgi:hypothetical protein